MSTVYSYLSFLFTTFTPVYENQYGFNTGGAGIAYLGPGVSFIIGRLVQQYPRIDILKPKRSSVAKY
ncbi:hypothetical protein MMC29_006099, partial [Sticta canariensis]|nr:hypothetical protein [Sticta canariensis]